MVISLGIGFWALIFPDGPPCVSELPLELLTLELPLEPSLELLTLELPLEPPPELPLADWLSLELLP